MGEAELKWSTFYVTEVKLCKIYYLYDTLYLIYINETQRIIGITHEEMEESKCVTTKKKISKAQNKASGKKRTKSYLQKTMNKMAIVSLFLSVITLYVIG